MNDSDKVTYAPFILITGKYQSLILSDRDMPDRMDIFEERAGQGWIGNGYDWASVARVVIAEKLPDLADELTFDPEAGLFSAAGSLEALQRLGEAMKQVFDDENLLRDVLNHAEIDS